MAVESNTIAKMNVYFFVKTFFIFFTYIFYIFFNAFSEAGGFTCCSILANYLLYYLTYTLSTSWEQAGYLSMAYRIDIFV